jgi:ankyrin repeat protein
MQNYTEFQIATENEDWETEIQVACEYRDWEKVVAIAKSQNTDEEDTLCYGDALLQVVYCNPPNVKDIVEVLLDAKAPTRWRKNNTKNTALHIAAMNGQTEIVKLLLEHGASLSQKNYENKTAIQMAAKNKQWTTVIAIAKAKKKIYGTYDYYHFGSVLLTAILSNPPEVKNVVKVILETYPYASETWVSGPVNNTALHTAVIFRNKEAFQLLVVHGADLSAKNSNNKTPIEIAAPFAKIWNDWSFVIIMAQAKNTDEYDNLHYGSVLINAVEANQIHVVEILLKANAPTWYHSNTKNTPLHLAAINKNPDMVMLLIKYGADLSARNKEGKTPFEVALDNSDWSTLNIIALHQYCNVTNKELYEEALLKALQENNYDTVQALLMADTKIFSDCVKYIDWTGPNAFLFAQQMFAEHFSQVEDSKRVFHSSTIDLVIRITLARRYVTPNKLPEHYQKLCFEIGMFYFNNKNADDYINALTFFILAGNCTDDELKAVCFLAVAELKDIELPYEPQLSLSNILTKNYSADDKLGLINRDTITQIINKCLPYAHNNDEVSNVIGELYYYLGRYNEAVIYWQIAKSTSPQATLHIKNTLKNKSFLAKLDAETAISYFFNLSRSASFTTDEKIELLLDIIEIHPEILLDSAIYNDIKTKLDGLNLSDKQRCLQSIANQLSRSKITQGEMEKLQTILGEEHFKTLFIDVIKLPAIQNDIHQNLIVKSIYAHILIHKNNTNFSNFILQFRTMHPSSDEIYPLFSLIDANKSLSSLEKYEWKGIIRQYALHLINAKTSALPIHTKITEYNKAVQQNIFADNRRSISNFFGFKTNAVTHLESVKSAHELNTFSENEKSKTIENITQSYSTSFFSSDESKTLIKTLKNDQINSKTKIENISSYLTENSNTNGKLVHQDKKLFKVIKSKLEEVSLSRRHVSR